MQTCVNLTYLRAALIKMFYRERKQEKGGVGGKENARTCNMHVDLQACDLVLCWTECGPAPAATNVCLTAVA